MKINRLLGELPKDKNIILSNQMNLLLKFLNPINNLPRKSLNPKLLILPSIQQDNNSIPTNRLVLMDIFLNESFLNQDVIDFNVVGEDFHESLLFAFL